MIIPARMKNGMASSENLPIEAYIIVARISKENPLYHSPTIAEIPKETAIGTFKKRRMKNVPNNASAIIVPPYSIGISGSPLIGRPG